MTDLERTAIGERIEAFRKSRMPKLSQEAFGEPIKLSRSTVNNLERGVVLHIEPYLKTIELYYRINPVWLLTGEGEMLLSQTGEDMVDDILKDADVFTRTWFKTLLTLSDQDWQHFKEQLDEVERIRKQGV